MEQEDKYKKQKKYFQTEKGKEKHKEASRRYYERHREECLKRKRENYKKLKEGK